MADYCSECTYLDISSGDLYGKFWCDKRLERHMANELKCDRFCEAYSRDSSTSKSAYQYSIDHSSSGGCYLTTMLCNILKLPDNNIYLEKMRYFRKNILQKNNKYKPILVEYDIIGPKIVKELNNDPLKEKIAKICFNTYIIPITNLIDISYEKAIELYINMTNNLKDIYDLHNFNVSNLEIDSADISVSGHGTYKIKKITSQT